MPDRFRGMRGFVMPASVAAFETLVRAKAGLIEEEPNDEGQALEMETTTT